MSLRQFLISTEVAHDAVAELGELENVQLKDVRALLSTVVTLLFFFSFFFFILVYCPVGQSPMVDTTYTMFTVRVMYYVALFVDSLQWSMLAQGRGRRLKVLVWCVTDWVCFLSFSSSPLISFLLTSSSPLGGLHLRRPVPSFSCTRCI